MRVNSTRSGFTLVEIVISICIISVAFYTLINVLSGVTYKNVGSQQLLTASFLAEETMEEYTVKSWDNIISRATQSYSGEFSKLYNRVDVIYVDLADLNGTAASPPTNYKRIEVTVTGEALTYPVKLVGFKAKY